MQRSLLVTALGAMIVLGSCGNSEAPRSQETVPPTTATPVSATAPPTTSWSATAPQPSPDSAAARLISAWSTGNQALARTVASPSAVSTLFAQPYPAGYLQARGCTTGANPGTCTYRNTRTDAIYEIQVTSGASGWYVSAVTPET
ncbi:MAG TPA: hypothetical protein VFH56_02040 [Acidimicrobiales bacterium]|nr:hypothetical protein [Acidimicrobiales bacterium]